MIALPPVDVSVTTVIPDGSLVTARMIILISVVLLPLASPEPLNPNTCPPGARIAP